MPLTDEQQLQHKTAIKIAIEAGVLTQVSEFNFIN